MYKSINFAPLQEKGLSGASLNHIEAGFPKGL